MYHINQDLGLKLIKEGSIIIANAGASKWDMLQSVPCKILQLQETIMPCATQLGYIWPFFFYPPKKKQIITTLTIIILYINTVILGNFCYALSMLRQKLRWLYLSTKSSSEWRSMKWRRITKKLTTTQISDNFKSRQSSLYCACKSSLNIWHFHLDQTLEYIILTPINNAAEPNVCCSSIP